MTIATPAASEQFPRIALLACAGLVTAALVLTAAAQLTGYGRTPVPESIPVQTRSLVFRDAPGGGVEVVDAATNLSVRTIQPGNRGFVRVVMRGLATNRRRSGVDPSIPFNLTRWQDGRLSISDPSTGGIIQLRAFGYPNERAFSELLENEGG